MTTETKNQSDGSSIFMFALLGALAGSLIAAGREDVLFVIVAVWVAAAFAIGTFVFCVYLPYADKKKETKRLAMQRAAEQAAREVAAQIAEIRASSAAD